MRTICCQKFVVALVLVCLTYIPRWAPAAEDLESLEQQAFQTAVDRVAASVVRIETIGGLERAGGVLFGTGPTTGLVVDSEGYIVSAAFNFLNQPTSILVQLADGTRRPARLVATDHNRMLVLLQVEADVPLPVPEIVPADEIHVGAWAIAVGRAFDSTRPNMAVGVVSAKHRIWGKAIQTDAAVSPNNYGGPLLDIRGRVLGVLVPLAPEGAGEVAGAQWYDSGIGMAIPGHDLEGIVEKLKQGQDLFPGVVGINFGDRSLYTGESTIAAVRPNSPAYDAGLKSGDRIVSVGGRQTDRGADVKEELSRRYAGDTVTLVVLRNEQRIQAEVQLVAELEPYQHPFVGFLPLRPAGSPPKDAPPGVRVRYVYPESPAAEAGLEQGDVLVGMDGERIDGPDSLRRMVTGKKIGDAVEIELRRGEESLRLSLTLGPLPENPPAEALPSAYPDEQEATSPSESTAQTGVVTIKIPEFENDAWAYVPRDFRDDVPHGLLVWVHPPGDFDRDRMLDDWQQRCDRDKLILVMPQSADENRWVPMEARYLRKLVDELGAKYAVDLTRLVLGGRGTGGTLAYLTAMSNRDVCRAVVLINADIIRLPPENEPIYRVAFYVAKKKKGQVVDRTDAAISLLREMKYPVCVRILGDRPRDLNAEEIAELVRWIDTLDRI